MKRICISVFAGVAIQGIVWALASGHFGPCGTNDLVGMVGLFSIIPGGALVDRFHIRGVFEVPVLFFTTALILAAIVWVAITAYLSLKHYRTKATS